MAKQILLSGGPRDGERVPADQFNSKGVLSFAERDPDSGEILKVHFYKIGPNPQQAHYQQPMEVDE